MSDSRSTLPTLPDGTDSLDPLWTEPPPADADRPTLESPPEIADTVRAPPVTDRMVLDAILGELRGLRADVAATRGEVASLRTTVELWRHETERTARRLTEHEVHEERRLQLVPTNGGEPA